MKAHEYWSVGALITMLGTFYSGYKGSKSSHKYFAASSLLCMIMAIYTGHRIISKNRIIQPTLCPLGTKLAQSLRCQEKSWHLFLCLFTLQKIILKNF